MGRELKFIFCLVLGIWDAGMCASAKIPDLLEAPLKIWQAPLYLKPNAAPALISASPVVVRVRVLRSAESVLVRGIDLRFFREDSKTPAIVANRLTEWRIQCRDQKVWIKREGDLKGFSLGERIWAESMGGFVSIDGKPFRDRFFLRPSFKGGGCDGVNHVDLEKYLDGLVNAEFSSQWSPEAVMAQVIAARSYAFYQILKSRAQSQSTYDLESTVEDQVYNGSIREDFKSSQSVLSTRGMVLVGESGSKDLPIKAFYHSTCGGITETPQNVWGRAFVGVGPQAHCPFCKPSPAFQWSADFGSAEIVEALARAPKNKTLHWPKNWGEILSHGQLENVISTVKGKAFRNSELSFEFSILGGKRFILKSNSVDFRRWMGPLRFKSSWFSVKRLQNRFLFVGRGYGHGVGLCQWGAKGMGEKGYDSAHILHLYYPEADQKKMW